MREVVYYVVYLMLQYAVVWCVMGLILGIAMLQCMVHSLFIFNSLNVQGKIDVKDNNGLCCAIS
jgi:hypothetical protein